MRVTHGKYGSLLVNMGELICMLKSNISYRALLSKATIKNDKCNVKSTDKPTDMDRSFLKN